MRSRSPYLPSLSAFAPRALDAFFGGSAKGSNRSIMRRVVRFMACPTVWKIVPSERNIWRLARWLPTAAYGSLTPAFPSAPEPMGVNVAPQPRCERARTSNHRHTRNLRWAEERSRSGSDQGVAKVGVAGPRGRHFRCHPELGSGRPASSIPLTEHMMSWTSRHTKELKWLGCLTYQASSACHACPPTNSASAVRGCLSVIGDASMASLVSHTDNCY